MRIDPEEAEGIRSPGARFRLRKTTPGQLPLWVAARGGELARERGAADHDRTAVFTLDQLRNLDRYWNAGSSLWSAVAPSGRWC